LAISFVGKLVCFFFLQNNYSENREVEKNIEKRKRIGGGKWWQLLAVFGGGSGWQWWLAVTRIDT